MSALWKWLKDHLFARTFFRNTVFPSEVVLYSHQPVTSLAEHLRRMEGQFSRDDLYRAVMKACGAHKHNRDALWFHINIIDQAVWTFEDSQAYPYPLPAAEKPLATMFRRMEQHPADQGGTTYVGLLSADKKWLLLIEKGADSIETGQDEADFKIRFCGSQALCKTVRSLLKAKAA